MMGAVELARMATDANTSERFLLSAAAAARKLAT
jgi:hypothetical protein